MTRPSGAIPLNAIAAIEAFELLFHVKFPAWRERMTTPGCFKDAADWVQYDRDERAVTKLLYDSYRDGTISFYVRDVSGEVLRLPWGEGKNSWIKHAFSNGSLASNLGAGADNLPVFLMKADVEQLAKRCGGAVRSRGGRPHKYDRKRAMAFLKREFGDGPALLNTCSQAKAAEKLMAYMSDGNVDQEPSKSWAEAVVSGFIKEAPNN